MLLITSTRFHEFLFSNGSEPISVRSRVESPRCSISRLSRPLAGVIDQQQDCWLPKTRLTCFKSKLLYPFQPTD
ncbi:hypothetical protein M0804_012981 [Polistes exclamans]|nr:hypothetical protein M0804_012981 [Polistes exclamans]